VISNVAKWRWFATLWNAVTKEISKRLPKETEKGSSGSFDSWWATRGFLYPCLFRQVTCRWILHCLHHLCRQASWTLYSRKLQKNKTLYIYYRFPNEKKRKRNNENEKPPAEKSIKIPLYPTAEDQQKLRNWIGCSCWTYKECLRMLEEEKVPRVKKVLWARVLNAKAVN